MKVYTVSDGEYSDWHIVGIFSDEKLAEKAAAYWDVNDYIQEYEVDKETPQLPEGMLAFAVPMEKTGDAPLRSCARGVRARPYRCSGDDVGKIHRWRSDSESVVFYVFARNAEHAVKIANEKRTGLLAGNNWPFEEDAP